MPFTVGQVIEFKPEYQDPGDANYTHVVVEDNGDRVLVATLGTGLFINPTQTVKRYMIQCGEDE